MTASFSKKKLTALVSTIEPIDGGVPSMTKWFCKKLEENDITPSLAWYCPWRNKPELSVPLYKLISRRPKMISQIALDRYQGFGIGAWLPELEYTHYLPVMEWKRLIKAHDLHFVVSGNPIAATPYVLLKTPFLAWIATPWEADRKNRVETFSTPRKLLDSILNKPVLSRLEARILRSGVGKVLSLSNYTAKQFRLISNKSLDDIMIMPVSTDIYYPAPEKTIPWRVGFSGRFNDPRKNITLLLRAVRLLRSDNHPVELVLVGDGHPELIHPLIKEYRIGASVICYGHKSPSELSELLQTLDLFVIPSHQEGLCISALEAMACGVPVVSTRCGGPEDYVVSDQNGKLVDNTPVALAEAIVNICSDRMTRDRLSINATSWIMNNASEATATKVFESHLFDLITKTQHYTAMKEVVP